jgi:membrane associated rhomboid family serine protease
MYAGRPSVCRSCGALVGAGEGVCAVCGMPATGIARPDAPPASPQERREQPIHDIETLRFARAVLTRPSTFTFVFLAVNVFIFLLMSFAGATDNPEVLLVYGAKYNAFINQGEWWRFVTPIFLHVSWLHLFVNMYSLFILGPYVEKLYGSARFVFFWVATGIAGVVASYLSFGLNVQSGVLKRFFSHDPSAGASGALFGLVGVLFVFGIKFRHELPEGFKRAFGTGMLPTILINLFIGFALPFVDNAGHIGGFVAGAVLALFVGYKRPGQRASVAVLWHILQFAALALVVVSFGQIARHMGAARANPLADGQNAASPLETNIAAYVSAVNDGRRAFAEALGGKTENLDSVIGRLESVSPLDDKSGLLRDELKELLVRGRDFARQPESERASPRRAQQLNKLVGDFQAWQQRSIEWSKNEGRNFGIVVLEQDAAPEGGGNAEAGATPEGEKK